MAYSLEEKERILNDIFQSMENGTSLRKCLIKEGLSSSTFFIWIDEDPTKSKQYERSMEIRAEALFDELMEVAYNTEQGKTVKTTDRGIEETEGDMLGHRRLKVDTLKWAMSKMFPKKFGDKVDMTTNGKDLPNVPTVINMGYAPPLEELD